MSDDFIGLFAFVPRDEPPIMQRLREDLDTQAGRSRRIYPVISAISNADMKINRKNTKKIIITIVVTRFPLTRLSRFDEKTPRTASGMENPIVLANFFASTNEPTSFLSATMFIMLISRKHSPEPIAIAYTPATCGSRKMQGRVASAPTRVETKVTRSLPSELSIGVVTCARDIGNSITAQLDTSVPAWSSPKSNVPICLPRGKYITKKTAATSIEKVIALDSFLRTVSISPLARSSATSGISTTDSELTNITGAIIRGSAIPATLPYSAVAADMDNPLFTSI